MDRTERCLDGGRACREARIRVAKLEVLAAFRMITTPAGGGKAAISQPARRLDCCFGRLFDAWITHC